MYRMQVYDERSTGMHWQVHKVGARHGKSYYERGERMPVAVTIGGDPAYTFAATAPLPDGLDEILFAGYIRKKPVDLVKCETVPLEVPADVDFVLEGYVQPGELRGEGPFGDHTGFYTPVDDYPVFRLTAITHRQEAVYPCTIVGIPPMEDFYMGTASVRIFLPVFQMNFPEIVDLALPAEGVFHNLVFVSIRKQYPWQAYKIMHGLWGMGQMMFSKYIIIVDEDCDVHNTSEVLFRLCANTDPQRDSTFVKSPCDALDHGPTIPNMGSHLGIDATRKLPGEGYTRGWPELLAPAGCGDQGQGGCAFARRALTRAGNLEDNHPMKSRRLNRHSFNQPYAHFNHPHHNREFPGRLRHYPRTWRHQRHHRSLPIDRRQHRRGHPIHVWRQHNTLYRAL